MQMTPRAILNHGTGHKPFRVLIVDDHPLVREGLAKLIQETPDLELSGEAGDVKEALQAITGEKPDVLLLDLSLPGRNGIELIKDLHLRYPDLPVLVLSMHEESFYAERVLSAGASGYIMKQEPAAHVIEALRTVLQGAVYLSPAIGARLLKTIFSGHRNPQPRTSMERLSNRELQVFECIGQGLTTQEIAAQLHLSVKTIETYRAHVKLKLGFNNHTELTHQAIRWVEAETGRGPA